VFPELAIFAHRDGRWHEPLGSAPPLEVVIVDPGGEVDTVVFNRLDHARILERLAPTHARIFERLKQAMKDRDWASLGAASSESAEAHQTILYSEWGSCVSRLARDVGALGVCRAHSGTIWGVLVDPARADTRAVEGYIAASVPDGVSVCRQRIVSGGPRYLTSPTGPASSGAIHEEVP
jgi:L-threonine kinase